MKRIITSLILSLSSLCIYSQVGISADSTFVPTTTLDVDGSVKIRTDLSLPKLAPSSGYKWLIIDQTGKVDSITLSSVTADNGLTLTSNNIQLGGTLTKATDIAQAGFNFRFTGSGSVGIGITTVPSHKLHVAGGVRAEGGFVVNDGTASTPGYRFNSQGNIGMYRITTDILGFATAGTERVRIGSAGEVQINTLVGTGTRQVYADASGILTATEPQITYFTTGSQVYATAGTNTFTVPAGITKLKVFLLGAGGGGVYGGTYYGGYGGAGGHVEGELAVTPGESLTVVVGTGGAGRGANTAGGGGTGSSISRSTILLAGAGGGAGGSVSGTAAGYTGQGGGAIFGTSINGNTGSTTSTISSTGGNNYIGYLTNPVSSTGGGFYTNSSFASSVTGGGNLFPSQLALGSTMTHMQTTSGRTNGKGGNYTSTTATNNNGMPGMVVILW